MSKDIQYMNEGLFSKSADYDVCKDFYKCADNIIDKIESEFSKVAKGGLIFKGKTLADDKGFNKSITKAKQIIASSKDGNKSVLKLSVNVRSAGLSSNAALGLLAKCISGFKTMKKYDSAIKNFFKNVDAVLYKTEKDNTYTVLSASITTFTTDGLETGLDMIHVKLTNLPDTDKTRKRLNLENTMIELEDCTIDIGAADLAFSEMNMDYIDNGIFNEATFINETSFEDLEKAKKQFYDNHSAKIKELNDTLSRIKNNTSETDKDVQNKQETQDKHRKIEKIQDRQSKDLDDLLSSFKQK